MGKIGQILKKLWCIVQVVLHVIDLVTDCGTLTVYWNEGYTILFGIGITSVAVSLPIGVGYYIHQFKACRGIETSKDTLITIKLYDILLESVPQLTLNLYVMSDCANTINKIQYISAIVSILAFTVGITHFDISIRAHRNLACIHKSLIFLYRMTSLAARILAIVYLTYYFSYWALGVAVIHWTFGVVWYFVSSRAKKNLVRSVVQVLLNTFVFVGEASGLKVVFILLLYIFENILMVGVPLIIQYAESHQITQVTSSNSTVAVDVGTTAISNIVAHPSGEFFSPTINVTQLIANTVDVRNYSNVTQPFISNGTFEYGFNHTVTSDLTTLTSATETFCLHKYAAIAHVALNSATVVACMIYCATFRNQICIPKDVREEEEDSDAAEDVLLDPQDIRESDV